MKCEGVKKMYFYFKKRLKRKVEREAKYTFLNGIEILLYKLGSKLNAQFLQYMKYNSRTLKAFTQVRRESKAHLCGNRTVMVTGLLLGWRRNLPGGTFMRK